MGNRGQLPVLLGNPGARWLLAIGLLVLLAVLLLLAKRLIVRLLTRRAERDGRSAPVDRAVARVVSKTHDLLVVLWGASLGASTLALPRAAHSVASHVGVLALFVQIAAWGSELIAVLTGEILRARAPEPTAATTMNVMALLGKVALWAVTLVVILGNLGVDITALVAGLGVSSIAVALAAQSILADVFASVAIAMDKPFSIGDFIVVDTLSGTVEAIGLKSTRLRSLDGEIVVFANSDLLKSRVLNYRHLNERRVLFTVGIREDTPYETVKRLPGLLKEIVASVPGTRLDRAHLRGFGTSSFDYEVVYYVLVPDYTAYMDIQQEIHLKILESFAREGVLLAYPTQVVHLERAAD